MIGFRPRNYDPWRNNCNNFYKWYDINVFLCAFVYKGISGIRREKEIAIWTHLNSCDNYYTNSDVFKWQFPLSYVTVSTYVNMNYVSAQWAGNVIFFYHTTNKTCFKINYSPTLWKKRCLQMIEHGINVCPLCCILQNNTLLHFSMQYKQQTEFERVKILQLRVERVKFT